MLGAGARDMKQKARQPTEDTEVIFRLTHSAWQRRVCKEEVTPQESETSGVHRVGLGASSFILVLTKASGRSSLGTPSEPRLVVRCGWGSGLGLNLISHIYSLGE